MSFPIFEYGKKWVRNQVSNSNYDLLYIFFRRISFIFRECILGGDIQLMYPFFRDDNTDYLYIEFIYRVINDSKINSVNHGDPDLNFFAYQEN